MHLIGSTKAFGLQVTRGYRKPNDFALSIKRTVQTQQNYENTHIHFRLVVLRRPWGGGAEEPRWDGGRLLFFSFIFLEREGGKGLISLSAHLTSGSHASRYARLAF